MGRPRLSGHDLPTGVYLKRGVYYRVIKGRWHRIGSDPNSTLPLSTLPGVLDEYKHDVISHTRKVITRARQNAKGRRGIPFDLTAASAEELLAKANWRCAVTHARFSLEEVNGTKPYAPSIDRVDCSRGYSLDNCRVVCLAVNFAMNVWGEDVLWRLFGRRRPKVLDRPLDLETEIAVSR